MLPAVGYYADNLSGARLRACYELAPPRVRAYLAAELAHVTSRLSATDTVLELGCGYGRFALPLAGSVGFVVGIDTAHASLREALAGDAAGAAFLEMDARALGFRARVFDAVVCIQNGLCAFGADPGRLLAEAVRVTRPGGACSSRATPTASGPSASAGSGCRRKRAWWGDRRGGQRRRSDRVPDGFRVGTMRAGRLRDAVLATGARWVDQRGRRLQHVLRDRGALGRAGPGSAHALGDPVEERLEVPGGPPHPPVGLRLSSTASR